MKEHQKTTLCILIAFILIVLGKLSLNYIPVVQKLVEEVYYNTVVENFTLKTVEDMKIVVENDENALYYLGRGSCGECRDAIKKVNQLRNIAEENFLTMFYNELPDILTQSEDEFYKDSLKIDSIPVLILIEDGEIRTFDFNSIFSETYKELFEKFIQKGEIK